LRGNVLVPELTGIGLRKHCEFIVKGVAIYIYRMELLEYENQIFLDAFQEDGLLVMAE